MRKRFFSLLTLGISIVILALLYRKIEPRACKALFERIRLAHVFPIVVSLVAIDLLTALRWRIMTGIWCQISYIEGLMHVLASSALNVIVPSKLGGLAKAYFLSRSIAMPAKAALSLVIYERLLDLAMLSVVFMSVAAASSAGSVLLGATLLVAVGIVILFFILHLVDARRLHLVTRIRRRPHLGRVVSWLDVFYEFHTSSANSRIRLFTTHVLTLIIWLCHALQLVCTFWLIVPGVPALTVVRNMFSAIFVGFLPVSTAGVGTRDMAIVYLFRGLVSYEEALLVGAATTFVRYVIPTLIGIPFLMAVGSWRVGQPGTGGQ
ncbi:MAG: flippase-like domain-containing protein [Kiritimatiellae bacterium]|nr:flippase-like domain-containing protein [Kiritimatiellia bacterium]